MFKKLLLATFAAGLFTASTLPLQMAPAQAGLMNISLFECAKQAKAKNPGDRKAQRACRKSCRSKKDGILASLRKS